MMKDDVGEGEMKGKVVSNGNGHTVDDEGEVRKDSDGAVEGNKKDGGSDR